MQSSYGIFPDSPKVWAEQLSGDILRFGTDVEVLGPPDLRTRVGKALHQAAGHYV
jgi:predicted DNA-binding transcriptional regulator YafY